MAIRQRYNAIPAIILKPLLLIVWYFILHSTKMFLIFDLSNKQILKI